jgi:hypothetical protein
MKGEAILVHRHEPNYCGVKELFVLTANSGQREAKMLHALSTMAHRDCLCGLVVRVAGYRFRGPGSIPSATRFSEKQWVWNGGHSAS